MKQPQFTLLYDGNCPICAWEKNNLTRRDRHGRLGFINIQSLDFDASAYGVTQEALLGRLHAITADGRMLVGFQTLLESYRAVGWWWVYLPLRLIPRRLAEFAYGWFADHRYRISGRIGHWFGPVCEQDRCRRR
jgi:predicted DCC family thiol-disulfide oxidoreductase YuxK